MFTLADEVLDVAIREGEALQLLQVFLSKGAHEGVAVVHICFFHKEAVDAEVK